jgi:hypothetical protein
MLILFAISLCLGAIIGKKFSRGSPSLGCSWRLFAAIAFKIGINAGARGFFCNLICTQCSLQLGYLIGCFFVCDDDPSSGPWSRPYP